jgi:hypothetical protein
MNGSLWDIMLDCINTLFRFMTEIEFNGISAIAAAAFGFVVFCMWRFILSPLFGVGGGSYSVSASDTVMKAATKPIDKK